MLAYFQIGHCTTQIVMFGDSLFAGYGLDSSDSIPSKLENFLKSQGKDVLIINAGVSGNTTIDGLARIDNIVGLKGNFVVLELGGNDMLRGFDPKITYDNLEKIIQRLKKEKVKIILVMCKASTNYGPFYKAKFDQVYEELADKYSLDTLPFFMEYVFNNSELMQVDGIHPNAKGVDTIVNKIGPQLIRLID